MVPSTYLSALENKHWNETPKKNLFEHDLQLLHIQKLVFKKIPLSQVQLITS